MKDDNGIFLVLILFLICTYGWILNIYKLVQLDFEKPYQAEVIRIIGVPVGMVGAVVGYVNFEEEKTR